MATKITAKCSFTTHGVRVCYPPQNSPGGSGITGVGSVNYLTKIITLVGADGSAIVTVGNSLAYESGGNFFVDNGYNAGAGTQLFVGSSGGGLSSRDSTNASTFSVEPTIAIMQAGTVITPITSVEVNLADILVRSPNITDETYAYFQTDGMGRFTLRSGANPSGITLSTPLTGLSITGSSITSSDTVIGAFGALQNQINGILGGAEYQGVWNATTNSPSLSSGVGTKGHYYVVSVAGSTNLDGITDWKIGDWAIFNGTAWDKVDNTDAVSSVNGAIGAVVITATGTANRIVVTGGSGLTPTFDIGTDVVTLTGSQALTNKTYNGLIVTSSTGTLTVANGTTITMPTATSTVLANSLGLSGGTTLIGGTGATDLVEFRKTSGNQVTGVSNIFKFTSGNNGANELVRFGDGIAANIGEFSAWAAGQSSTTTHMWRAGTNFSYFNAGTDLRLTVGAVSYLNCLSGAGTFAVQKPMTFASGANVTLVAGSTTLAPLIMTSGTYKTTPAAGSIEYNGQFSMTPTDATRRYVVLAASSTKTTAGAPYTNDGYVTMNINGTDVKVMTTA